MNKLKLFSVAGGAIDAAAGIISGVSVITIGEARGHEMYVDQTTLDQVLSTAQSHTDGLKVKADHWSGFNDIVGQLKNFRNEGEQTKADFHLLENHDSRAKILEMAEKMPSEFGFSIVFSGDHEELDIPVTDEAGAETTIKRRFARCTELYSCDLVDQPAANPNGLFSADELNAIRLQLTNAEQKALSDITALKAEIATRDAEIKSLKASAADQAREFARLNDAHSILKRTLGLNPRDPIMVTDDNGQAVDIVEKYNSITDRAERLEFYRKHKSELFARAQGGGK